MQDLELSLARFNSWVWFFFLNLIFQLYIPFYGVFFGFIHVLRCFLPNKVFNRHLFWITAKNCTMDLKFFAKRAAEIPIWPFARLFRDLSCPLFGMIFILECATLGDSINIIINRHTCKSFLQRVVYNFGVLRTWIFYKKLWGTFS